MEFCEETQRSIESCCSCHGVVTGPGKYPIKYPIAPSFHTSWNIGTWTVSHFAHTGGSKKNIVVDQEKGSSPLVTFHYTTSIYCIQFCVPQYRKGNDGNDGENSAEVIEIYS